MKRVRKFDRKKKSKSSLQGELENLGIIPFSRKRSLDKKNKDKNRFFERDNDWT